MHWLKSSVILLCSKLILIFYHIRIMGLYKLRYATKRKGASLDIVLNITQEKYVLTGICLWDFWALPAQEST